MTTSEVQRVYVMLTTGHRDRDLYPVPRQSVGDDPYRELTLAESRELATATRNAE